MHKLTSTLKQVTADEILKMLQIEFSTTNSNINSNMMKDKESGRRVKKFLL